MKNLLRILVVIYFVIILPIGAVALVSNPSPQNVICGSGELWDNARGCVQDPSFGLTSLDPTNSSQDTLYGPCQYGFNDEGTGCADNPAAGVTSSQSTGVTTSSPSAGKIRDPLGNRFGTVPELIKTILEGALRIGMPVVALAIVYCGFLFVSASGNPEKLKKAKDALLWTLIGAAILLGSWAIAKMISDTVLAL